MLWIERPGSARVALDMARQQGWQQQAWRKQPGSIAQRKPIAPRSGHGHIAICLRPHPGVARSLRHMVIVMILMHRHQGASGVNQRYVRLAYVVEQPDIPAWASDGKFGQAVYGTTWKDKKVDAVGPMPFAALAYIGAQRAFPTVLERQRRGDIDIVAVANHQVWFVLAQAVQALHRWQKSLSKMISALI